MARLILVRHGETEWNRQMRYQGQTDIELNETGIGQARKTAERLASEKIDIVYCSDLSRARKTAEIITSKHPVVKEIYESSLLREMNFGDLEGLTFNQMEEKYQLIFSASSSWKNQGTQERTPNGESIADLAIRINKFAEKLTDHRQDETVLIVAHGGALQVLICRLLEIGLEHLWQIRMSSAAVSILETYHQGTSVILLNGNSHLSK